MHHAISIFCLHDAHRVQFPKRRLDSRLPRKRIGDQHKLGGATRRRSRLHTGNDASLGQPSVSPFNVVGKVQELCFQNVGVGLPGASTQLAHERVALARDHHSLPRQVDDCNVTRQRVGESAWKGCSVCARLVKRRKKGLSIAPGLFNRTLASMRLKPIFDACQMIAQDLGAPTASHAIEPIGIPRLDIVHCIIVGTCLFGTTFRSCAMPRGASHGRHVGYSGGPLICQGIATRLVRSCLFVHTHTTQVARGRARPRVRVQVCDGATNHLSSQRVFGIKRSASARCQMQDRELLLAHALETTCACE